MYQFYYADTSTPIDASHFQQNIHDRYTVTAVRPTMWEEHCLECAAPLCFNNCVHYKARSDGRCMRFENGLQVFESDKACMGQGVRVSFRKWANMMTVLFPGMAAPEELKKDFTKNQKKGAFLKKWIESPLPQSLRWQGVRTVEFLRRRKMRSAVAEDAQPDAFLFHGYSHHPQAFQLILEVYDDHTSIFRTSLAMQAGENIHILQAADLSPECWKAGNLVKIYPEQDLEVTLDVLWCDFVKGAPTVSEAPAPQVKCMVWDLDNTVWDGTFVETDDPDSLKLREGVLEMMKTLDERGIVQSVASKNEYELVYPLLEKKGIAEYFLYPQIHWGPKSGSLEQIAKSLNIGIDSLALIDDSVFERNQVISTLPQVRTYDAVEVPAVLTYPECDVLVTAESRKRRAMYRAEEKRHAILQSGKGDVTEFLKKCHLRMELFSLTSEEQKTRCYELIVRTNQLNMSGKKYTPEEFEEVLSRKGHTSFGVSCRDDFGDYGIVGFGQYRVEDSTLVFTEFAMSCRVAGKYVESALFAELLKREGCSKGQFPVVKTKKNSLLRNTLQEIGFAVDDQSEKAVEYSFTDALLNTDIVEIYC